MKDYDAKKPKPAKHPIEVFNVVKARRKKANRDKLAAKPLPVGFEVAVIPDGRSAIWRVTTPKGDVWESAGCFYDRHDGPDDTAESAARAWGIVAVHRKTYAKGRRGT